MKHEGLVSVKYDPNRKIAGPVAILMSNEDHFLGAYVSEGKLVLEMMPKSLIEKNTSWLPHYPYSQQLLARLETLDGGTVTATEKSTVKEEIRRYGSGSDGRRTTFSHGGSGAGQALLEEVRSLAGVTKEKLAQVDKKN